VSRARSATATSRTWRTISSGSESGRATAMATTTGAFEQRASDAAITRTAPAPDAHTRYDRVSVWLHWSIGLLLLAEIAFGLLLPPWGPDWPRAYALLVGIHDASAYLLLALTIGHVALALKHALLERDGIFDRIAPRSSARRASPP